MTEQSGETISIFDKILREGKLATEEGHLYTDVVAAFLRKNPNLAGERLDGVTEHLQSCPHCNERSEKLRDHYFGREPGAEVRSIPELQQTFDAS